MNRIKKGIFGLWLAGCLIAMSVTAQTPKYARDYFRNPLALPMELQANMGELRPDHWHMGLDLRTAQKENQIVMAAADGYIASIGVRPGSFGRFIIINHPNGLSTLYAHLNDFYPELETYVTEQQYKNESWAIELRFNPDQFKVIKGQFIAYSGNTGGSQGPHLHFEIMNTKTEERLNPLLFGLPVSDNTAPSFTKLAMYNRSKSVYDQSPQFFSIKNTDSGYILSKPSIIRTGLDKISFAIQAFDRMNSKSSQDGIYSAELFFDDVSQVSFVMDSISYDETGYINAQIDYKLKSAGGGWLQHLSKMPGDFGKVYKLKAGNGVLQLADTFQHRVRIEIKDAYNNASELNFIVQHDDSLASPFAQSNGGVSLTNAFLPAKKNICRKEFFEIEFPPTSFYDTVNAFYFYRDEIPPAAVTGIHQFGDASVPVQGSFTVRIQPEKIFPPEWKDKLVMTRNSRGTNVRKVKWQGNWMTADFGDLGAFQVFADLTAPTVNELGKGDTINLSPASRIIFTPNDNFAVKSFRAELDSQWIRFTNDKSRNWIYIFDDRCPYGVHHLKVTVEDIVGNSTTKEWWFKRYPYTPPPKKKTVKKSGTKKKTTTPAKKTVTKKKKK